MMIHVAICALSLDHWIFPLSPSNQVEPTLGQDGTPESQKPKAHLGPSKPQAAFPETAQEFKEYVEKRLATLEDILHLPFYLVASDADLCQQEGGMKSQTKGISRRRVCVPLGGDKLRPANTTGIPLF